MTLKNILVMFLLTAAILKSQNTEAWSGNVTNESDTRKITIEVLKKDNAIEIRWSMSGANIYRMPAGESYYKSNDSLFVVLPMFGHPIGKIEGKFSNDTFTGYLTWAKKSFPVLLEKVKDYKLPFNENNCKIINNEVTLDGTFITPEGSGPFPAVVFINGSGPAERWWAMFYAKKFAEIGIASLLFDKRGSGKSTGSWITSSLEDLTNDASAAISFLKSQKEIDANKIGIYGVSQGGWIASRLAVSNTVPAFEIVNSGGGSTPYETEILFYNNNLKHSSLTDQEKEEAINLANDYLEYLRTGNNRQTLIEKITNAKTKEWYKFVNIERVLPSEKNRKNWEWVPTYNPVTDIEKINFPVLILLGDKDDLVPVESAVKNWKAGLDTAQNKNYEIKIFENAGHALQLGGHGSYNSFPRYAEGSLEYQINWLKKNILFTK